MSVLTHDAIGKSREIMTAQKISSVAEWYKGQTILVTGATGFMGKVLLEKLLSACSELKKIYIIVRAKRGTAPSTRIRDMLKLPLFENLRKENPKVIEKIVAIEGEMCSENFKISAENIKLLHSEVTVVFHCAATLRLEANLKDAVHHNLYGTDNMLNFCRPMKKLKALIHLSTAFCHCDIKVLEEKIYPPTVSPKHVMDIVEWMNDETLDMITSSIIEPHPNTYTFTKRLAETLVYESGNELPVVIIRPSIVIPTIKEPIPGWVDSLNGPVGILIASGKGVIRSMLVDENNHAEIIPVDIAVNGMITAAWHRGNNNFDECPVYNLSQSDVRPITWGEVLNRGKAVFQKYPFDWPLWYPDGDIRTNVLTHNIIVFLFQVIPAYFVDFFFAMAMKKTFLVRVQKRIKLGMYFLQYFTLREWKFRNKKFLSVLESVNDKERDIFYSTNIEFDVDRYMKDIIVGARKYCLKEKDKDIPGAKRYLMFLFILDRFFKFALLCGLLSLLYKWTIAFSYFSNNSYSQRLDSF